MSALAERDNLNAGLNSLHFNPSESSQPTIRQPKPDEQDVDELSAGRECCPLGVGGVGVGVRLMWS